MKKQISVLNLLSKSSIYRMVGLFFMMGIVEFIFFRMVLLDGPNMETLTFNMEYVFRNARMNWIFGAALILLTIILCATGYETSSKQGYTLMRLSISEERVFELQALYNFLCYIFLWAVQLLIVFLLGLYFIKKAPGEYVTNQTFFLAFYRNEFLHALLPFDDILIWIKNGLLFLSLGFCSAGFTYAQRRGKRVFELVLALGVAAIFFTAPLGKTERSIITSFIFMFCFILTSLRIYKKEGFDER